MRCSGRQFNPLKNTATRQKPEKKKINWHLITLMLYSEDDEKTGNSLVSSVNGFLWSWTGKGQVTNDLLDEVDLEEEEESGVDPHCTKAKMFEKCEFTREVGVGIAMMALFALVCGVALIVINRSGEAVPDVSLQKTAPSIQDGTIEISVDIYTDKPQRAPQKEAVWTGDDPPTTTPGDSEQ